MLSGEKKYSQKAVEGQGKAVERQWKVKERQSNGSGRPRKGPAKCIWTDLHRDLVGDRVRVLLATITVIGTIILERTVTFKGTERQRKHK